ncbi:Ig-like domain-containing protein [Clostridiisalibacter paucivorans]|uniref:Ig-like domain-containing protein n=1 Tax=Clostridiisalibacter paucivorans TaxID=408753 RepID=UPI00047B105B|nr:Ig-like domain-containing protein [Clostridiisalibacter paucivorans]
MNIKRTMSIFLCVMMVFSLLPINYGYTGSLEDRFPTFEKATSDEGGNQQIYDRDTTSLGTEGSIYIHFDREIKLADSIDDLVNIYGITEDEYIFENRSGTIVPEGMAVDKLEDMDTLKDKGKAKDIDANNITVLENNKKVIKIILKDMGLKPFNKYKLALDRDIITDNNGLHPTDDIVFTFWAKKASDTTVPKWSIDITDWKEDGTQDDLQKDQNVSTYDKYYIEKTDIFSEEDPLVMTFEQRALINHKDKTIQTWPEIVERISYDILKEITFIDIHNNQNIAIDKYQLDTKEGKTQIKLYPSVDAGKSYRLIIPEDVFITESGKSPKKLQIDFTTKSSDTEDIGIYDITPNKFSVLDIKKDIVEFNIEGYNFNKNIEGVVLSPKSGNATVQQSVYLSDVYYYNPNSIQVRIKDEEIRKKFSTEQWTGTYEVQLSVAGKTVKSPVDFEIASKGIPEVIDRFPEHSRDWIDENSLITKRYNGDTKYFLKITFSDLDGTLEFDTTNGLNQLQASTVYAEGGDVSFIDSAFIQSLEQGDIERYIFSKGISSKEAYLYIPVKPLSPQTKYNVNISPDIVYYAGGQSSDSINWSFTTMAEPTVSQVSIGSVVEDYDEDEPIILRGDFFYDGVDVYFNDIRAEDIDIRSDDQGTYLEVYLPDGRDRLDPGTYKITVKNDRNHSTYEYGAFSVVKSGDYIPNEETRLKEEDRKGDVLANVSVNEDTIVLDSKYRDDKKVTLNLDELMGTNILTRKIQIPGRRGELIGVLQTKSQWADIFLYGVGLSSSSKRADITITVGRTNPHMESMLKEKLKGIDIKSDFIEVSGENLWLQSVDINMPFKDSDGSNIKVYRYDKELKKWFKENAMIDKAKKNIVLRSNNQGIFVAVEVKE